MNWGVSLDRRATTSGQLELPRRQRQTAIGGAAEPGTYAYANPRLTVDMDCEFRVTKAIGFFAGARTSPSPVRL